MLVNGQRRSEAPRHESILIYLTNIEFLLCARYCVCAAVEAWASARRKG